MHQFSILGNELCQLSDYWLRRVVSRAKPVVYNIETTNRCPMTCQMCPRSKMTRPLSQMSLDLFRHILNQFDDKTAFLFLDHFGDPLLCSTITEMIKIAGSLNIQVGIETNPQLLTPKLTQALMGSTLDLLHLSLDGTCSETLQRCRGHAANYDLALHQIEFFLAEKLRTGKSKPFTTISMVHMKDTSHEIDTFRALWSRPGIDSVMIKPFSSMAGSVGDMGNLSSAPDTSEKPQACFFPWSSLSVLVTGEVVPCCFDYNGTTILGDLKNQTLREIWNGSPMQQLREQHIQRKYENNLMCANCKACDRRLLRSLSYFRHRLLAGLHHHKTQAQILPASPHEVALWYA